MFTQTSRIKSKSDLSSAAQPIGKIRKINNQNHLSGNLNIQAKLTVGQPDDKYEQEADRVANQVMSIPANDTVQRSCSSCMGEENSLQTKPLATSITPLVQMQPIEEEEEMMQAKPILQRQPIEEEEEMLQPKFLLQRQPTEEEDEELQPKSIKKNEGSGTAESSSGFEGTINQSRGSGQHLPSDTRSFMESRFGTDFGCVKVHTDSTAIQMNKEVRSQAFTVGDNIYFNSGRYHPGSSSGKKLLAHELTHTIQQNGLKPSRIQRWAVGAAPAPTNWEVVSNRGHLRRLTQAENIVRGVLSSRNCRNYFRDNCTNGVGANALQQAFDNVRIYLLPHDNNTFGEQSGTSNNIAFNLRAFRIGRYMMASTLLHEMFHTCDPTFDAQDELDAENAVETCRLHTPWINNVTPGSGGVGSRVRILGWGFGPTRGPADRVSIGGMNASIVSWTFLTDNTSRVEIEAEVPARAAAGGVVVINNGVRSNVGAFAVS